MDRWRVLPTTVYNILAILAMAMTVPTAQAQNSSLITDDTGGVTPPAIYCPSTGGGCFTSREAAVSAMRAATPHVGHLLVPAPRDPGSPTIFFHVPDQAPASYGASLYGIDHDGVIGGDGYCPQSLATQDRPTDWGGNYCYDEAEMFDGFIARPKSCGWHSCSYRDYAIFGEYAMPYSSISTAQYIRWVTPTTYIRVNTAQEGWIQHSIHDKYIQYLEDDHTDGSTRVRTARMMKIQRFACPEGMLPIATTDITLNPRLCRSSTKPHIRVTTLRQAKSCAVNAHPCHPSSGDKSRAETDFTFAGRPFVRHYHSLRETSPRGFRMGEGWTHSFASQMLSPNSQSMLVTSDGYWAPYIPWNSQHWMVPSLDNASLDAMPDGSWNLTESNGDISTFVGVRLTRVRTPGAPERDVALEYSATGQLLRLIDGSGRAVNFTYDLSSLLTQVTLPDGTYFTYQYDANENLVRVVSSNGTDKQYHYGEPGLATNGDRGLLTGITYEDGIRYASFGYDIHGRVLASTLHGDMGELTETTRILYNAADSAQVTLSSGQVRTYTYTGDFYRKPITVSDTGGTTSYTYNGYSQIASQTDKRGAITRYGYTNWRMTSLTSAFGTSSQRTVETDWNTSVNLPSERRVRNASNALVTKTNWTYNALGQVLSNTQTDPAGTAVRTTAMTYCEQTDVAAGVCPRVGLLLSKDGPRTDVADITSYLYYASDDAACATAPTTCSHRKGDLWKIVDAEGHVSEILAYDGAGRPILVKDANDVITEFRHDELGRLVLRRVHGDGNSQDRTTHVAYWPTGPVKMVTQPDGSYTRYHYDNAQRLVGIEDGAGNSINYTLDNAGNRIKEDTHDIGGALKRTLARVYDQLGRLLSQTDAYGNATDHTYDANGNIVVLTDALGRSTSSIYDPLDRLVMTLQDVGGIEAQTRFAYDAQDNLIRVTDPKGLHTHYTYDGFGDLLLLDSPDTGTTQYQHDSAGNLIHRIDARNSSQSYTYDALNRLTQITRPERQYFYDSNNSTLCPANERSNKSRLSGFDDPSGSTRYCHNRFGDLTRKIQTIDGKVFTTKYGYDAYGRSTTLTYPDGAVLDAVFNTNGQIAELGITPAGGIRQVVLTGVTYAPFGPATGWQYGNGRSLLRPFNLNYQPDAVHDANMGGLSLGYIFDAAGNLTLLQDGAKTQNIAQYGYDALNRLSQVMDGPTGALIETYSYDETGNRLSVINAGSTIAYNYPSSSHRLEDVGGAARTHDAAGNTTEISDISRQYIYDISGRMTQVISGGVALRNYKYDAKGQQTVSYIDTERTYFVYDEIGNLLGGYARDGNARQQIIWFGGMPVGLLQGSGADQRLHYIEPDHLGTPRVIVDGLRDVAIWTWSAAGEAFGMTQPNQDADNDGVLFDFDLRYPGQRHDAATGLSYNYFRDYDPATGRYVQSDPIGLMAGVSTYSYVSGSPLIWADMYGLLQWSLLPVQWSSGTTTGTLTRTYPGAPQSVFREDTLARTTIDWTVGATCSCTSGGFSLNEFQVSLTPIVLLRQRYDTPAIRSSTRRDELDHVRDLNNWANGAKSAVEMFEDAFKNQTFPTEQACLVAARAAMQSHLSSSIYPAIDASRQRWDVSGKHRLIIP
ncbi:RHS repeat-associated core domain-containing protein [Stenotrophomonas acidaminiphila]